jgi:hypothetical protein
VEEVVLENVIVYTDIDCYNFIHLRDVESSDGNQNSNSRRDFA